MPEADERTKAVWSKLNDDKTIKLLMDFVSTPSSTGNEAAAAELLGGYMEKHGVSVRLQEVEEGRKNAIGTYHGEGGGPSVLFNGHLDTSFTGNFEEDYAMAGDLANMMKPEASLENGLVFGLGARNMKGGVTAMVAAISALAESGVRIPGDVIVACVAGEIEKTPVQGLLQSFEGKQYRGCGVGMRYALEHGLKADFGITTEPTSNRICRARVGFTYIKLTTKGTTAYVPMKSAGMGDNAILKMSKVIPAIEEQFAPSFIKSYTYELAGGDGTMMPQVSVGGIQGGLPFKPNYVPALCCSYVSIFFPPNLTPRKAIGELEKFTKEWGKKTSIEVEVEPYLVRAPATETEHENFIVNSCKRAYELTTGEKHTPPEPASLSIGDDSNSTRVWGMPSVTWGPGGTRHPGTAGRGEYVSTQEVTTASRMYAATIIDICGRPKHSVTQ